LKKFDHNIGICEKRQLFRRKLEKIAENCDHNIDPWTIRLRDDSSPQLALAPPDSPPQVLGDEPMPDWLPLS
jgi:hypothetical protein